MQVYDTLELGAHAQRGYGFDGFVPSARACSQISDGTAGGPVGRATRRCLSDDVDALINEPTKDTCCAYERCRCAYGR